MLSKRWVFLILALCLLSTAVSAAIPYTVDLSSSKYWVVANKSDSSTITAYVTNKSVTNGTILALPGATVVFSLSDPTMGTLSTYSASTDSGGYAITKFTANTTKGNVTISAKAGNITASYNQHIDHDTPYYVTFDYSGEVAINETSTITATYSDYWGNLIDELNTNEVHTASFQVSSPTGGAGFNASGSYPSNITKTINNNGIIVLGCKVDTTPGDNIVYMAPLGKISAQYFTIVGISEGVPYRMIANLTPIYVYANGDDQFTLTITLYDVFGYPTRNRNMWVNTSLGESTLFKSNSNGQVIASYGPKTTAQSVLINITTVDNATVRQTLTATFVNTSATSLVLTADPESMASLDVPESIPATLYATVLDDVGNPVPNETVTFTLMSYTNTTVLTSRPSFSSSSYVTSATRNTVFDPTYTEGVNGIANLTFYPGKFPVSGASYYCQTASGTATIKAQWSDKSKTIVLSFKNYPYLSVKTSVDPAVVEPGGFFDVHLQLIGDGWMLQPYPINVSLCTDRSGSMQFDNPDRMVSIMAAEKTFVANMNFPRDFIGIVTFGHKGTGSNKATLWDSYSQLLGPGIDSSSSDNNAYINANYPGGATDSVGTHSYSDYAVVDQALTNQPVNINDTISRIIPYSGTPMRAGVYQSITQLNGTSPAAATSIKAVILLSDGDYNYYGDPLARGSKGSTTDPTSSDYGDLSSKYWCYSGIGSCPSSGATYTLQNLSNYAKYKNIKIYSIAYGSSLSSGGQTTLRVLAEGTGGKYYTATATNIADVYTQIAGELKKDASVNTTAVLSFQDLSVTYNSSTTTTANGKDLINYEYNTSAPSTWVNSYNKTVSPMPDTLTLPSSYQDVTWLSTANHYPYTFNQTKEWASSPYGALSFDIGTISVNQTWETKFRFRVAPNANGTIDIFGPNSIINMNNGASTLTLPHTFVSVVPNLTNNGTVSASLDITNLQCTKSGNITDYLPVEWNLNYNGTAPTITEKIYYTNKPVQLAQWVLFKTTTVSSTTTSDSAILDVRSLPYGDYYIKVYATDNIGAESTAILQTPVTVGAEGTAYIKLE